MEHMLIQTLNIVELYVIMMLLYGVIIQPGNVLKNAHQYPIYMLIQIQINVSIIAVVRYLLIKSKDNVWMP